ncbi:hypothetical protein HYE67_009914 [Fusarium culmorum]|uniref:Lipid droplet-associated hydrolase n=3 Tax=Fusarium sambucinum species complex TaxID=569360 RepID=I1REI9_GIBZE|nr:hypothetical protein FGSG_02078 [Fusarium graminearum PH-1]EYB25941.1 hypothetical protein FG05_02078 [Fusarium graminearum]PTD13476.1 hypothetical protein FCULG_00004856 [Fusarium culmorum]ESU07468.1 hypothetical protein FGSG_02078 [Fusarium graminearum PH-1]QPC67683.1 hypothetical protein HYE67_009914 [Fusarium culmorum]CAF3635466.1 unnamed protein product [Fusarium graminearum]|eukprot:XP_011317953.1 hypothetical protein FGSG_02078 [Fusarium graminearum PH-1]
MAPQIWLPSERPKAVGQKALIYYICGNPGLIEYYTDFLSNLRGLLDKMEKNTAYDIYGTNLLGFSDDDHEPFNSNNKPWGLDGQVEGMYDKVAAKGEGYDFVILMGHSVGSFIAVEIFHRHMNNPERAPHLKLRHGFLLFPTLTHLARSSNGVQFVLLRRIIPFLDTVASLLARLLLGLLSVASVTWIVQRLLGFTHASADVTARWLKSRDGVLQAVHLGLTELEMICEENWSDELWATAGEENGVPRFFLFYAKKDHWVHDAERKGITERRGHMARIAVDEGDIPHAFCTRQGSDASLEVARKVCEWVKEIDGHESE